MKKKSEKLREEKFIADNYPGSYITLPDGLRYKILVPGKGNTPADGSVVKH